MIISGLSSQETHKRPYFITYGPVMLFHGTFSRNYGVSHLPVTPAPGKRTPSPGLYRPLHAYMYRLMHIIKNNIRFQKGGPDWQFWATDFHPWVSVYQDPSSSCHHQQVPSAPWFSCMYLDRATAAVEVQKVIQFFCIISAQNSTSQTILARKLRRQDCKYLDTVLSHSGVERRGCIRAYYLASLTEIYSVVYRSRCPSQGMVSPRWARSSYNN